MQRLMYMLALVWVVLIATSIIAARQVEGPRNIDTGFRALEVLVLWQMAALGVAIVAMVVAIFSKGLARSARLAGFAPIGLTIVVVAGVLLYATFNRPESAPAPDRPVTAPALSTPVPVD